MHQYPHLDFKIIKLPILENCSKTANNIVLHRPERKMRQIS